MMTTATGEVIIGEMFVASILRVRFGSFVRSFVWLHRERRQAVNKNSRGCTSVGCTSTVCCTALMLSVAAKYG